MFKITRVKNYDNKIIDDLGIMEESEFIEFAKRYIGNDTSRWGVIFKSEKELLDNIKFIKENGDEYWSETKDTNLIIKYIKKEGD